MLILPRSTEPAGLNEFPVLYWNHVALEMNRITHSLGGSHTGPTMSSRALGLLHLAMHDAFFGTLGAVRGNGKPYEPYLDSFPGLTVGPAPDLARANVALTAAALTVLDSLYGSGGANISILAKETITSSLTKYVRECRHPIEALCPEFHFGQQVAGLILHKLAVKPGEIGADPGFYKPKMQPGYFRDEPVNPVKRVYVDPENPSRGQRTIPNYHGPFYGRTVSSFATHHDDEHILAPPPMINSEKKWPQDYLDALREVKALGGAPGIQSTRRGPDQTVSALYWAYDGANLIGTPPRLYNQILRIVAWKQRKENDPLLDQTVEMVRLFALCNSAMADAGKFAWREKYKYELWRPLSGIREHDPCSGPLGQASQTLGPDADPFWLSLGAPETNSHKVSFKPPFPAYPSGHATFGAACFHMVRLFYAKQNGKELKTNDPDSIGFDFVSDELNGICRDLHEPYDRLLAIEDQPGVVRTHINRSFPSLRHAIFDNAISRIYLGVHWRFDAFDPKDALKKAPHQNTDISAPAGSPPSVYEDADKISYSHVWEGKSRQGMLPVGGVPLGLGIANDIWQSGLTDPSGVPPEKFSGLELKVKSSNTNVR